MSDPRVSRLLDAVLLVAGDLDLETILRRIVEAACSMVDARYGALGVIAEDRERLSNFVHHGIDEMTADKIGSLPEGRGILGLLIDEPQPLRLADLSSHQASYGFPEHHPPMNSFLGAPIRVREQVFGNIYLAEKLGAPSFSQEDEDLLTGLAAVAGAAIDNARLYDDVRRRERWRDAVLQVSAAALEGRSLMEVRTHIARLSAELADADFGCIVAEVEGDLWMVAHSDDGEPLGRLAGKGPPVWDTLTQGSLCHVQDGPLFPSRAVLWVPLREGDDLVAALGVVRDQPFHGPDEDLLSGFAENAALALTHEQIQSELQRLELIEDRERIGRDLHDTVIQRLFATGLSLQAATRFADDHPELLGRLDRAVDDIDETVKEIRSTIFALQARPSDQQGVRTAVLDLVEEMSDVLSHQPRVRFDGPIDTVVRGVVAQHLVPVVREALTNVGKHADADDVQVSVTVDEGQVEVHVRDNGVGVSPNAQSGFGLRNLRERARSLGGDFSVTSGPEGRGTVLRWRVPAV